MNVTPTDGMFAAMTALVDATVGEEPGDKETSTASDKRRQARRQMFDVLHNLTRLSMRVGVARFCVDRGIPVVKDEIQPDKLAKTVREDAPTSSKLRIVR